MFSDVECNWQCLCQRLFEICIRSEVVYLGRREGNFGCLSIMKMS